MLFDEGFVSWLQQEPAVTWTDANLFLNAGSSGAGIVPKEPSWEVDLFRESSKGRSWAIGFVDPFSGSLINLNLCDLPCDH